MSEYATVEHYVNHVIGEITKRDVERVSERLRALGWEEIVRCRDCKYYGSYDGSSWCCRTYEQVPSGTCDYQTVEPDGFCAWGERRDV